MVVKTTGSPVGLKGKTMETPDDSKWLDTPDDDDEEKDPEQDWLDGADEDYAREHDK